MPAGPVRESETARGEKAHGSRVRAFVRAWVVGVWQEGYAAGLVPLVSSTDVRVTRERTSPLSYTKAG